MPAATRPNELTPTAPATSDRLSPAAAGATLGRAMLLVLQALMGRLGGQAVLEGVMLRGPQRWIVAVRRPDNRIAVMVQTAHARPGRSRLARVPFIRGMVVGWEALTLGVRALAESAKVVSGEDEAPTRGSVSRAGVWVTVLVALAVAIALFFLIPLAVTRTLLHIEPGVTFWLVEGAIRVVVLILYLASLAFVPDMRRMMQYHAAEHMAINAYERGARLDPDVAATQPRHHPRCGTAFLLAVMVIAIIVFAVVGDRAAWILVVSRIVGLPLIAGISYEVLRFAAASQEAVIGRALALPGRVLQRLTTREPTADQLEVACVGLRRLLAVDPSIADPESRAEVLA